MFPYQSVHFVGILSPSMASLAMAALLRDATVSGSDDRSDPILAQALQNKGVKLFDMFAQVNVHHVDVVVLSRFYDTKHPEASAAAHLGIPVVLETDFLKTVIGERSAMVALGQYESPLITTWLCHVWRQAGLAVSGITGGITADSPLACGTDEDRMLVSIAGMKRDSTTYEPDFLSIDAATVMIPSIMYDFPELYMTLDDVYQAYYTFVKRVPRKGLIIGNSDWSRMKRLRTHLADRHIESFGFDRDAGWHIYDVTEGESSTTFFLRHANQIAGPFTIHFRGRLFVTSAAAVIVASLLENIAPDVIGKALETLPSLKRYFEVGTDRSGRIIIDDCADHPSTIEDVLLAVRACYPGKKIWCLYQSGSFLRSKALQSDFEDSLSLADSVYIGDIIGQPKEKSEGLHARHLVANLRSKHPQTFYFNSVEDTTKLLDERIPTQDCIVTLGATGFCQEITERLITLKDE